MGGLDIEYEMNCSSSGMSPQLLSEKVSEMALNSVSILKSTIGADTSFTSSWEPHLSLCQNGNLGAASTASGCEFSSSPHSAVLENEGVKTTPHFVHDPSHSTYDMFGSDSFSEMIDSFGLAPESGLSQIADIKFPFSNVPNLDAGCSGRASANDEKAQVDCVIGSSPNGKRRKLALGSNYSCPNKNAEGNSNIEPSDDFSYILQKDDDKIPPVEQRISANSHSKSNGKQAKENSHSFRAPKENYIHVRARRGQATNSHSLAERVRREKIGERMKFLQELVPGCNQISGKAVMLDEIINYVQSLQQQVEFLSMKLANVDPELNFDSEQIPCTHILHSQGINGVFGIDPRLTTSHTVPHAMFQFHGTTPTMPRTSHQLSSLPQIMEEMTAEQWKMAIEDGKAKERDEDKKPDYDAQRTSTDMQPTAVI